MEYAVVIHHEEGSAYGVTVPDLPGCFSAGNTFHQALEKVRELLNYTWKAWLKKAWTSPVLLKLIVTWKIQTMPGEPGVWLKWTSSPIWGTPKRSM